MFFLVFINPNSKFKFPSDQASAGWNGPRPRRPRKVWFRSEKRHFRQKMIVRNRSYSVKIEFSENNYLSLPTVSCIFSSLIIFMINFLVYYLLVYCLLMFLLFVLWKKVLSASFYMSTRIWIFLYFGAGEHMERNSESKSKMDSSDKIGK